MKRGLLLLTGLVGATFAAHFFMADPGYVLVNFRGVAIELSVPGLLLFAVLAYVLVRLVIRLLRSPFDLGRATGRYRNKRARTKLTRGLIESAEGNHARAERMLAESAHGSETPVLNYLGAATAAQEQGATDRRDNWLMMAYESDAEAAGAVLLTQARLQASEGDHERALASLRKLEETTPGHPQGLALLARIYSELGDWESLRAILPQLRKRKALPVEKIEALSQQAWTRLLEHDGARGDVMSLQRQWQAAPKKLRNDPRFLRDYVVALNRAGEPSLAEQIIRARLKKHEDAELVDLYSRLEEPDAKLMLANAEGWLRSRPEDPALLVAAGRLALRSGEHDKARKYLETAIELDPSVAAYQTYGAVLTETGATEEAARAFRQGLALATGRIETTLPVVVAKDGAETAEAPPQAASDTVAEPAK